MFYFGFYSGWPALRERLHEWRRPFLLAQQVRGTLAGRELWTGVGLHLRLRFATGLLFLVPIFLTYVVLRVIFDFLDGQLQPIFRAIFDQREFPGVGLVALILLVYASGLVASSVVGRRLFTLGQQVLLSIPLVRTIYGASKKLVESFTGPGTTGLQRVVVIEYPRPGAWGIGFLTGFTSDEESRPMAMVYIPTVPLPNSGWMAMVPIEDVYDTDLSAQVTMQMVFSGGILTPSRISKRPLRESAMALPK